MNYSNNQLVFMSRQNILDMLEYRGFNTSTYQNFSREELDLLYEESCLNILVDHKDNPESCLVLYVKHDKMSLKKLKDILGDRGDGIYNQEQCLFSNKNI